MNKPWVGYLSAAFLFVAGVLQYLGGSPKIGILFALLAVASVFLNIYMYRRPR